MSGTPTAAATAQQDGHTSTGHQARQPPPWLQPERFDDPGFNAETVVADIRHHVSVKGGGPRIRPGRRQNAHALSALAARETDPPLLLCAARRRRRRR